MFEKDTSHTIEYKLFHMPEDPDGEEFFQDVKPVKRNTALKYLKVKRGT